GGAKSPVVVPDVSPAGLPIAPPHPASQRKPAQRPASAARDEVSTTGDTFRRLRRRVKSAMTTWPHSPIRARPTAPVYGTAAIAFSTIATLFAATSMAV